MIIEEIIKYNEQFVASKGYEKYLTSKYPDKKLAILSCMDTRLTELLPAAEKEEEKQEDNTQAVQVELSQEDKQNVARIAHKLQPIAQMLQAECQQQLQALSPEHIGEQKDKKIRAYIQAVYDDLGNMLGELRNILSE